jgi:hypothetical protein
MNGPTNTTTLKSTTDFRKKIGFCKLYFRKRAGFSPLFYFLVIIITGF